MTALSSASLWCSPPRRCWPSRSPLRPTRLTALGFVRPAPAAADKTGAARAGFSAPEPRSGRLWMRALGPGSVSSFLKIILDVVFAALWIGLGAVALLLLAALLFSFNPDLFPDVFSSNAALVASRG